VPSTGGAGPGPANLVEIFSSIQGEGPHVGARTLFVRFGECDLRCCWCDSPHTWRPAVHCEIELEAGSGRRARVASPVPLDAVVAAAERLEVGRHRFVSLTGGEPLLQPDAVAAVARELRARGPRVLLETHGLAEAALARVVDAIDVVSMDWKLASDVRRASDPARGPVAEFHDAHERFLRAALAAPEVVVKIVVTPASGDAELDEACARVARTAPRATLVLQPVTPCGAVRERPSAQRLLDLALRASRVCADVRVIPQTHPIYGVP
jgi:organic radical activating enzyme